MLVSTTAQELGWLFRFVRACYESRVSHAFCHWIVTGAATLHGRYHSVRRLRRPAFGQRSARVSRKKPSGPPHSLQTPFLPSGQTPQKLRGAGVRGAFSGRPHLGCVRKATDRAHEGFVEGLQNCLSSLRGQARFVWLLSSGSFVASPSSPGPLPSARFLFCATPLPCKTAPRPWLQLPFL